MNIRNTFSLLFILAAGGVLALQGCSTTDTVQQDISRNLMQLEQSEEVDQDYKIKIGDEIEILVWEEPDFNTTTTVSQNGTIAIPLIGEINIAGMTRDELDQSLRQRLSEYIRGEINLTISIRNTQDMMVSVLGKVSRPDNYPVVNETSIFSILSTAGGPTDDANLRKVKIYRKSGASYYDVIDLNDYLESGRMDDSITKVYPGDVIYVPKQQNAIREMSGFLWDVALLFGIFRILN